VLHLHRSERADALVVPLSAVLSEPLDDPFTADVLAVPTRGVERWLAQRLSHVLGAGPGGEAGVCANVAFPSPGRLAGDVLARASGLDPDQDPWRPAALLWSVLGVVDECAAEPWCSALGRHLGAGAPGDAVRQGRRLGVARHLAGLFAGYAAQRPDLVLAWAAGRDEDGAGAPVPHDLAWQPVLWRRLRERLGVPSPAERLAAALDRLAAEPGAAALPGRVGVFGPTRLPDDQLRLLAALGRHRDVHLWLPHPSPVLWDRVAAAASGSTGAGRRRDTRPAAAHPLLASMARDATELQRRLAAWPASDSHHPPAADPPPGTSLLGLLQARLRADDATTPPVPVPPGDTSVRVHACHGRARQVEVLREVVLGLLSADRSLEPRDVVVMCPDVEAFAPLVGAAFGGAAEATVAGPDGHPGQQVRVRLADRSLRQTNPVLGLVSALLDLADGRVTASEVLDLAASEPVRGGSASTTTTWSASATGRRGSGVRLGPEPTSPRAPGSASPAVSQGTWRRTGSTGSCSASRWRGGPAVRSAPRCRSTTSTARRSTSPAGSPSCSTGSVAVDRPRSRRRSPLGEWLDALGRGRRAHRRRTERRVAGRQAKPRARRRAGRPGEHAPRRDVCDCPTSAPCSPTGCADAPPGPTSAPAPDGVHAGADALGAAPGGVPARPRRRRVPARTADDGDDVLPATRASASATGAARTASCFLDAVTAAGSTSSSSTPAPTSAPARRARRPCRSASCSTRSTAPRPPGRRPGPRDDVVVRHPLQPVDARNFVGRTPWPRGPFSFDGAARCAALAGRGSRVGAVPFLPVPLPAEPRATSTSTTSSSFLEHPVRVVPARSGSRSWQRARDERSRRPLPLELDGLQKWAVGDRLLAAGSPASGRPTPARRVARGEVPPRELGTGEPARDRRAVDPAASSRLSSGRGTAPRSTSTSRPTARGGVRGSVRGVRDDVVRTVYSRLVRQAPAAGVGAAARADRRRPGAWRAVTVGRGPKDTPGCARRRPAPPSTRWPHGCDELVRRARAGCAGRCRCRPATSAKAYARRGPAGRSAGAGPEAASGEWDESGFRRRGPYRRRPRALLGPRRAVLADMPAPGPSARTRRWLRRRAPRLRRARPSAVGAAAGGAARGRASGAVRRLRSAARGHHRARGQRRHRQDLHDRRARHPLRRRGRRSPSWTSCCS
jgi:exodeoxyribonuclease V gamma subunit